MEHRGTYVNFLAGEDAAPKRVETAYDAGTYRRLTRLKAKVDPANTFRVNPKRSRDRGTRPAPAAFS